MLLLLAMFVSHKGVTVPNSNLDKLWQSRRKGLGINVMDYILSSNSNRIKYRIYIIVQHKALHVHVPCMYIMNNHEFNYVVMIQDEFMIFMQLECIHVYTSHV